MVPAVGPDAHVLPTSLSPNGGRRSHLERGRRGTRRSGRLPLVLRGSLPHLQVVLGAVEQRAQSGFMTGNAQPLDPVGPLAVVGDTVGVDVEGPVSPRLAIEVLAAGERSGWVVDLSG